MECGIEFENQNVLHQNTAIDTMMEHASSIPRSKTHRTDQNGGSRKTKAKAWPNISLRAEHQNGSI
jgi:hypothetical protein